MSKPEKQKNSKQETPKSEETIEPAIEPTISLSLEETALIIGGLSGLPIDRKKTVVFDRLMMKLGKVDSYWQKIEKTRQLRREQIASKLLEKRTP